MNDLAEAHLSAIKKLLSESVSSFRAVNIGTGKGTSVLQMIDYVHLASGKKVPYNILPRRPGDLASVYADSSLALEMLGWRAKRNVQESVESSWRFVNGN